MKHLLTDCGLLAFTIVMLMVILKQSQTLDMPWWAVFLMPFALLILLGLCLLAKRCLTHNCK